MPSGGARRPFSLNSAEKIPFVGSGSNNLFSSIVRHKGGLVRDRGGGGGLAASAFFFAPAAGRIADFLAASET